MLRLKHFPFLQLPLEIREEIYQHVLLGARRTDALACDIDDSILRTCRQIHTEGRPYIYKVNAFETAIWLPIEKYTPWPILPSNQCFLSRVQHLVLYWDMRQFLTFEFIRFESQPLRKSILNLKQICMALLQAGTRLRTLKVTMKIPGGIDFGHMPLGQYPFLSIPTSVSPLRYTKDPDALAPLKELRVKQVIFAGDFSEATPRTMAYMHEVKAIMEGYTPEYPLSFKYKNELDLDLMIRRNIYYYYSPLGYPSWEGKLHRELIFYAATLRGYFTRDDRLGNEIDGVSLMLLQPETEKLKGFTKVQLGPVLSLLEDIFQSITKNKNISRYGIIGPPQDLLAAREYFTSRPEIRKMMDLV